VGGGVTAAHGPEQVGAIGLPLLGELLQPTPLPLSPIGRAMSHGLCACCSCHWGPAWGRKIGPISMGRNAPEWGRFSPSAELRHVLPRRFSAEVTMAS
jgi:tetrahydromethanopterin S-methyltransferase subunit C